MRFKSIRARLLVVGFLTVFIPMAITMYMSNKKSTEVLTDLSKEYAQSMAAKLAEEVTLALEGAQNSIMVLINDAQLTDVAELVEQQGVEQSAPQIAVIQKTCAILHSFC